MVRDFRQKQDSILNDESVNRSERRRMLRTLGRITPDMTDRCSAWWGVDELQLKRSYTISAIDLGVGLLEPFKPEWIGKFPVFKDPAKQFASGRSLCKLGYPFHAIVPTYDEEVSAFRLPNDSVPPPMFPIEGMFTRTVNIIVEGEEERKYPLRWIETSSPGLRGQSGGPIFDTKGTIWGIQCKTMHYPLGFDPKVPGRETVREHQFLNVGLGVHPETMFGLFDEIGIEYEVSSY